MNCDNLVDLLSKTIVSSVETMIRKAKFDRTSIGVIVGVHDGRYIVNAFGGEYRVASSLPFSVGERVAVTAPQNNFKNLFLQKL